MKKIFKINTICICSLIILLFADVELNAQADTIIFGTGDTTNSTTNYPAPYGNWYTCSKHQIIIRSSELLAQGLNVSGFINSLGFNVSDDNGVALQAFTIKMKNTSDSTVTGTFDNSGLATVWGPQNYTDVNGWNNHVFSAPFYINPSLNLLIETCFCNGTSNWTYNAIMFNTPTSFPSVLYSITDGDASHCSNVTGGTMGSNRPDIKLSFTPDTFPPEANFIAVNTNNCSGVPVQVQFTDLSSFNPLTWLWDFGDGNTDTIKNPVHSYTTTGLFTVSLIVTNAYGSDTMIYTDYVNVKQALVTAACNPTVSNTGTGSGIYNVTFNSIANNTGSLAESYTDYSCPFSTTVLSGSKQTLSVETGPVWKENVRAWIDFNNDGQFNNAAELILSSDDKLQFHSREFVIPQNVVYDSVLRMRICSDYVGADTPDACNPLAFGQAEDYGVMIQAVDSPPEADFIYSFIDICTGVVQFNDFSAFFPSIWAWNFGDGSTATGDLAIHTFSPGIYSVEMIATNLFGSDTIIKTLMIDSVNADFILPNDTINAGDGLTYMNTSYGANSWFWDFGDTTSAVKNPIHIYSVPGTYTIWLYSTNTVTGCSDSVSRQIVVLPPTSVAVNTTNKHSVSISPNPNTGKFTLIANTEPDSYRVTIYNVLGEKVYYSVIKSLSHSLIDISKEPKGIYFIHLQTGEKLYNQKLIVE